MVVCDFTLLWLEFYWLNVCIVHIYLYISSFVLQASVDAFEISIIIRQHCHISYKSVNLHGVVHLGG